MATSGQPLHSSDETNEPVDADIATGEQQAVDTNSPPAIPEASVQAKGAVAQDDENAAIEYVKMDFDAWKKTVDVQQHFNDLELRIRNFAVTVLAGILGAAALALGQGHQLVVAFLFFAGLIAWLAFYFMDKYWYHQLLRGAVQHAHAIEKRLGSNIPGIALSLTISEASKVRLLGAEVRSNRRLDIFYWSIAALLFLGSIIFFTIGMTLFIAGLTQDNPSNLISPASPTPAAIAPTPSDAPVSITPTLQVTTTP